MSLKKKKKYIKNKLKKSKQLDRCFI